METFDAIFSRRSIRQYDDRPVPREMIEKIVDAGLQAPSGRNVQPVEFIAIMDSDIRNRLAQICSYGKFIAEAPVCLVVISKNSKYYLEDGSAAVENVLLAATDLGLGTCWVAGDKKPYAGDILEISGVPDGYKLICLISVGYAAVNPPNKKKKSISEGLHWERF